MTAHKYKQTVEVDKAEPGRSRPIVVNVYAEFNNRIVKGGALSLDPDEARQLAFDLLRHIGEMPVELINPTEDEFVDYAVQNLTNSGPHYVKVHYGDPVDPERTVEEVAKDLHGWFTDLQKERELDSDA